MKSLLQIIRCVSCRREEPWALATLVRTRGSTYRKPGARLLVDGSGETIGVLSGGCLEEEIARHGLDVIETGEAKLVSFDTRRLYGCDGQVDILIERLPPAGREGNLLTLLGEKLERRERCCIRTVYEGGMPGSELLAPGALTVAREGTFLHAVPLPVRLLLLGTGPEVEPILELAQSLAWRVEKVAHPSELTDAFLPDAQTAAVVMMHHFGRDLAALTRLLPMGLPYIGLLGPKKRSGELISRMQEFCITDGDLWKNLHAPAGLDTGSEAPEEIALSIVAEVAAVLAGRRGGCLRERREAIHESTGLILGRSA
jgi:xanthine/CO dehydrogenase XdhC/CoxF family maturation factor